MARRASGQSRTRKGSPQAHPAMTDDIRAEIVTRLAMFDSPSSVQADLREHHGIEITRQALTHYTPGNGRNLAAKWVELFHQTREDFLKELAAEPIAKRAYRLRQLGKIHELEMRRGNTAGARATLEQAAKETGNVFTNVSKVQGAALPGQMASTQDFSADEMRNMLADRLAEAADKLKAQQPAAHTLN